jgi:uncharacterized protein YegL
MAEPINVYVLLDTSASMVGAPLEALKQGLHLLVSTFIARSQRLVQVGLIGYESTARLITPLAEVNDFEMPTLDAEGSSGLGGAFRLLASNMTDHNPTLVYIFTDGEPTDDWEAAMEALRPRIQKFYGVLCGPTADSTSLDTQLNKIFLGRELTPDLLAETFRSL